MTVQLGLAVIEDNQSGSPRIGAHLKLDGVLVLCFIFFLSDDVVNLVQVRLVGGIG
jgi:hypothetical protein